MPSTLANYLRGLADAVAIRREQVSGASGCLSLVAVHTASSLHVQCRDRHRAVRMQLLRAHLPQRCIPTKLLALILCSHPHACGTAGGAGL